MLRTRQGALALFLCFFSASFVLADGASLQPEFFIDREDGVSRVLVDVAKPDGTREPVVLRETMADVELRASGATPAGSTLFAVWEESGERWSAWSRDAGESWAEAAPVRTTIKLRDGDVTPLTSMPSAPSELRLRSGGGLFVVQFETVGLPEFREALEAAGGEVFGYLPYNAHIVRMPDAVAQTVSGLDFVARVEPYHPWYRIQPEIRAWLDEPSESDDDAPRRIRFVTPEWGDAGKVRLKDAAIALGADVAEFWPSGHVLELWATRDQVRQLAHHGDVVWMDFWTAPETDMDLVREDAGTNWLENNLGFCGQGVRGEVMDSGVQDDHPDFDGILTHGPYNSASHGTSTYGIVFGNGARDGDGDPQGTGHMPCDEAQGIFADYGSLGDRFAHTQELKNPPYNASFQTNSWGNARTLSYNSTSQEMDDIIWRLDIAITQSQSNAGNQQSRPQAWAKNIISVGGIRHKNTLDPSDDEWANGASIGPAEDGRIKPDVNYWYDSIYTTTTGSGYTAGFGGTSAATPEVAGVLGLMVQMWSENVWGTEPEGSTVFERQPAASTMKALLVNNSIQYDFSGQSDDLTRVHQGWGRPNLQVAYERATNSLISDEEFNLEVGETADFRVRVPEGETELKITMVYPDPPGTTSASLHRINDLNLKVTSPSGTVYWGNVGLLDAPYSTPGGVPNDKDTVENVFVDNPEIGDWLVEISAAEINQDAVLDTPEDDATFALVVTGASDDCEEALIDFTITPNPALIGDVVSFESTVSGGAGGPYSYQWDFDLDGTIDSTEENPTHVYDRPYEGFVRLTVTDAEDCPSIRDKTISVTGPDPRVAGYTLVEIEGNGNGAVDPGEIYEVVVDVENIGNADAIGTTAELRVNVETPGPVAMLVPSTSYGDVLIGSSESSSPAFRFQVGQGFPCGSRIVFDHVNLRTVTPDVGYSDELGVIKVLVGGSGPSEGFYDEGFETTTGWSGTGGGEWQLGAPEGKGNSGAIPGFTPQPDPTSAFEGSQVAGTDLTGQGATPGSYENNVLSTFSSPPIDASERVLVQLDLMRWLNVLPGDTAFIEVSGDGFEWTRVYESGESGNAEGQWVPMSFDISEAADLQDTFRMRFGIESDDTATASGWNIDSIALSGVSSNSCTDLSRALSGAAADLLVELDELGDLSLSWGADCGGGTTYGVYRGDAAIGLSSLAPAACDVASTSTTLPNGTPEPGTIELILVVPNDGAFEGSYGTDSNGARRAAPVASCYPQDLIDGCAP